MAYWTWGIFVVFSTENSPENEKRWFPYSVCSDFPFVVISFLDIITALYVSFLMVHTNEYKHITHTTLWEDKSDTNYTLSRTLYARLSPPLAFPSRSILYRPPYLFVCIPMSISIFLYLPLSVSAYICVSVCGWLSIYLCLSIAPVCLSFLYQSFPCPFLSMCLSLTVCLLSLSVSLYLLVFSLSLYVWLSVYWCLSLAVALCLSLPVCLSVCISISDCLRLFL